MIEKFNGIVKFSSENNYIENKIKNTEIRTFCYNR